MDSLVAIVGPTGTGKSRLALELARFFNAEIVSADSRQIYRYLDIGTAKPTPQELSLIPHHLVNIAYPDDDFDLARYQRLARTAINDIQERNRLPLLVGGSGLYVWALLEGWEVPSVPPDHEFRDSLAKKAAEVGEYELYRELEQIDPAAAQRIDPRNLRRTIRALEVNRTGTLFSRLQQKKAPPFRSLVIGLTMDRQELYRRLDARIDDMIAQGWVEETEKLLDMDYDLNRPALSGIGYQQIARFLKGELTLAAAIQQIKFQTHRFVRHQYNWFRLTDTRIKWFDMQRKIGPEVTGLVADFIDGAKHGERNLKEGEGKET
ncbi:MAG TPA: tRNA (adenosine(37)-N6)-dimethylallyltransferase MiaA [Dehalococcoidia bacterium]|nr:tRNA (adenosine(37)-N6)-dimethylallyltransferase MiaA [Dehalococcoidia bacterium]